MVAGFLHSERIRSIEGKLNESQNSGFGKTVYCASPIQILKQSFNVELRYCVGIKVHWGRKLRVLYGHGMKISEYRDDDRYCLS